MKVGDLVNFQTLSWVMNNPRYNQRNPGVIIKDMSEGLGEKFLIFWSDQSRTVEHWGYLELVSRVDAR